MKALRGESACEAEQAHLLAGRNERSGVRRTCGLAGDGQPGYVGQISSDFFFEWDVWSLEGLSRVTGHVYLLISFLCSAQKKGGLEIGSMVRVSTRRQMIMVLTRVETVKERINSHIQGISSKQC